MALVDRRGIVAGWSRAAGELVGRAADEVLGRSVLRLLAEEHRARLPERGEADLRCGGAGSVRVRYWAEELRGSPFSLVMAVGADRAAGAEDAEAVFRALLSQDRLGFLLRDADLAVLRTNVLPGEFGGPPQPVGSVLSDVMEGKDAEETERTLREVLETGRPLAAQEQHVRSTRPPYQEWSLSYSTIRTEDAAGRPTGVAIFLTDATEHWRAGQRAELRHRASARVGNSLDIERTAQEIADTLVPDFADIAWVDLAHAVLTGEEPPKSVGGGDLLLRRVAVRSADGPWPEHLLQVGASVPPFPDRPMVREIQEGRTIRMDRGAVEEILGNPARIRLAAPDGGHSLVIAPLFARALLLGTVGVWRAERPDPFDEEDAELLTEIAAQAALSVDNARRYTREHRAVDSLQRRLLPQASTSTRVMETTGSYVPAEAGAEIGGDWFDAIALPSLRTALVVGDVFGSGLHATATMGRLRTAVQTLADLELDPDEVLTQLDTLVARLAAEAEPGHRDTVGATCLVALHDPVTRRCVMASAGHPPPILALPDGPAEPVDLQPGPPLGVGGLPFETATVDTPPGSVLCLYTDGLLRRYGPDLDTATLDLTDRLARLQRSEERLPSLSKGLMTGGDGTPFLDDAALLLARPSALDPGSVASWEFPAEPDAVGAARNAATEKLTEWGLEGNTFVTELIVSELVTNAVRHAGGPIGLRLIRGELLYCEVTDPSNTQPRLRRARTTDEGGRGLFLVAQLSRRWGSRYGQSGKTIWAEQELVEEFPE
ncbi:SpoIIE family protein phosphatase [Streptomyces albidoflavus]|uniref:ATP-binding SpoIIE family protein phosphatase n=1 Tax=Streptomyces albidoflavus TaxID=1886 RepID=UPI003873C11F|nr:SpoIIE family protein phosphatase [Streptomyces albidoflavus]